MRLRKKKKQPEQVSGPVSVLLMLEALRLAILAAKAGDGTDEAIKLRTATDHLAEKALRGLSWPTS